MGRVSVGTTKAARDRGAGRRDSRRHRDGVGACDLDAREIQPQRESRSAGTPLDAGATAEAAAGGVADWVRTPVTRAAPETTVAAGVHVYAVKPSMPGRLTEWSPKAETVKRQFSGRGCHDGFSGACSPPCRPQHSTQQSRSRGVGAEGSPDRSTVIFRPLVSFSRWSGSRESARGPPDQSTSRRPWSPS